MLLKDETRRSQLDLQINALELQLKKLRVERNSLCYTSQLPLEVLTRIFHLAVEQLDDANQFETRPYSYGKPKKRTVNILTLSHVSAGWRKIIHGTQRLWSKIVINPNTEPALTELRLRNVGNHPMSLHLTIARPTSNRLDALGNVQALENVFQSAERFRSLNLSVDHTILVNLLSRPRGVAHHLNSLWIQNLSEPQKRVSDDGQSHIVIQRLPENLFAEGTPMLTFPRGQPMFSPMDIAHPIPIPTPYPPGPRSTAPLACKYARIRCDPTPQNPPLHSSAPLSQHRWSASCLRPQRPGPCARYRASSSPQASVIQYPWVINRPYNSLLQTAPPTT